MGSLCLSTAPILRCLSFTRIQYEILIIPTALEVIFSTTLIYTNRGSGWRHLLITAEGWAYFALALLEVLSHTIPAVRDTLTAYKTIDIFIAATSFIPLLCYTVFIFLFTCAELIALLPRRFQKPGKMLLAVFIPAIIVLNEVASFVGISHRTVNINGRSILAIGFATESEQMLWSFFNSITLALLTAYQAINFCFAFIRLTKIFLNQRRIEMSSTDEAHLFRGTGWITGALKLGAIETVIGFADGNFGVALTRRILRFLARAFLCIGIVKGVDSFENFTQFTNEMSANRKENRRSRLRQFISNPRHSTFRQLSPTATAFHSTTTRAPHNGGLPGMSQFASFKGEPRQRVTVHYSDGAPTLHMRFSALSLPSPAVIVESVKARPDSEWAPTLGRASSYYPASVMTSEVADPMPKARPNSEWAPTLDRGSSYYPASVMTSEAAVPMPKAAAFPAEPDPHPIHNAFANMHTRDISEFSVRSYPDSLNTINIVRELTPHFPIPSPHVYNFDKGKTPIRGIIEEEDPDASYFAPPSPGEQHSGGDFLSVGKPEPRPSIVPDNIDPFEDERDVRTPKSFIPHGPHDSTDATAYRFGPSVATSLSNTPVTMLSAFTPAMTSSPRSADTTPGTENPFVYDEYPAALHTGKSRALREEEIGVAITADRPVSKNEPEVLMGRYSSRAVSYAPSDLPSVYEDGGHSMGNSADSMDMPWLKTEGPLRSVDKKAHMTRIKSVGKAPRRNTPTPTKTGFTRGSIYIEPITIPPKQAGMPEVEIIRESYEGRGALRDSDVLGLTDDDLFVRERM